MGKFYVVKSSFEPNTAATNRFLGLLQLLSKLHIETTVVFFISDKLKSRAPKLPYIHYQYYWDKFDFNNSKIKNLLYIYLFSKRFISKIKPNDIVYLYGCNEIVHGLVKTGARVFHERTEHPLVSKLKLLNIKKYLEACTKLDGLFVISSALKEYFTTIGVPEEKTHIINMTVDPTRFDGIRKHTDERYIAYCGKATNNKDGVDQLIKAFALVTRCHSDVKLYIIGTPPSQKDKSGNLQLVEELGLSDKVVFTGVIPAKEIPHFLANAEVLALARPNNMQAKYGFPTKLGEYLLTGNPVVITDVGDISLFLKDMKSALIAEPDSPTSFAGKLIWALDHPKMAGEIGLIGKEIALCHFNNETEMTKMINIIFPKKNHD